jgi:hypothetical protein
MKIILKTINKIALRVELKEIKTLGFDDLWDIIREAYPVEEYKISSVKNNEEDGYTIVFLEKKIDFADSI